MAPMKRNEESKIHIVVVESHHHILEHIHHVLRHKHLLGHSWSMLHFDSHPDLACPNPSIPAAACFQPRRQWPDKDLYELLDSTNTGMAEWILPLVLSADLDKVEWIRPNELSSQMPLGAHSFNVGAFNPSPCLVSKPDHFLEISPSATIRVDWNCPYYSDDHTLASTEELLLAKSLDLVVSERCPSMELPKEQPWLLDICLDYFACLNPFLTDIENIDSNIAMLLIQISKLIKSDSLQNFIGDTLKSIIQDSKEPKVSVSELMDDFKRNLECNVFLNSDQGEVSELLCLLLSKLFEKDTQSRKHLAGLVLEALPNLAMPHSGQISVDSITNLLKDMVQSITKYDEEPFMITIARSSDDGFTPKNLVVALQESLLTELHSVYCSCPSGPLYPADKETNCRLCVTFDFGPWEGSTINV